MTLLYLVRHGETDWNRQRRIQGSTDIPLNAKGRKQAAAAGALLARRSWDAIYASPLSRAVETADIIAEAVGLGHAIAVDALVERNYGRAEGMTSEQIDRRFPGDTPVPGRETREQVSARVVPALCELADQHPGQSLIVVAHGGVIRSVLGAVGYGMGIGPIRNGSIHSFRHVDGALSLIAFDDPIEAESLSLGKDDLEKQNAIEGREASGVAG